MYVKNASNQKVSILSYEKVARQWQNRDFFVQKDKKKSNSFQIIYFSSNKNDIERRNIQNNRFTMRRKLSTNQLALDLTVIIAMLSVNSKITTYAI